MMKRITTILPLLMLFAILGAGMMIPMYPFWVDHDSYGSHKYMVNVKSPKYGALGDGSTDDYASILAAITAAPAGSVIYFPVGDYKLSQTLVITKTLTLKGDGIRGESAALSKTRLIWTQTDGTNGIEPSVAIMIDGLEIQGNSSAGHGILLTQEHLSATLLCGI